MLPNEWNCERAFTTNANKTNVCSNKLDWWCYLKRAMMRPCSASRKCQNRHFSLKKKMYGLKAFQIPKTCDNFSCLRGNVSKPLCFIHPNEYFTKINSDVVQRLTQRSIIIEWTSDIIHIQVTQCKGSKTITNGAHFCVLSFYPAFATKATPLSFSRSHYLWHIIWKILLLKTWLRSLQKRQSKSLDSLIPTLYILFCGNEWPVAAARGPFKVICARNSTSNATMMCWRRVLSNDI
jgi:hypothetical protein